MRIGQKQVLEFHRAMGLTVGETPAIREPELRARLVLEEAFELVEALLGGSGAFDAIESAKRSWLRRDCPNGLPAVADACADLIYVTNGTAVSCGIDLEPIEDAVHVANMAKAGGEKDAGGKLLKPPGWTPPDIEALLLAQGWRK
jgi:predicted HAD superfamily Cof-like phosphohydrolase